MGRKVFWSSNTGVCVRYNTGDKVFWSRNVGGGSLEDLGFKYIPVLKVNTFLT